MAGSLVTLLFSITLIARVYLGVNSVLKSIILVILGPLDWPQDAAGNISRPVASATIGMRRLIFTKLLLHYSTGQVARDPKIKQGLLP